MRAFVKSLRSKEGNQSNCPALRRINNNFTKSESFKHTPLSTGKSRDKETKSRLELENKLRSDLINKYTEAVKDFNHTKKLERKNRILFSLQINSLGKNSPW